MFKRGIITLPRAGVELQIFTLIHNVGEGSHATRAVPEGFQHLQTVLPTSEKIRERIATEKIARDHLERPRRNAVSPAHMPFCVSPAVKKPL
jgi:hypothetical protein